MPETFHFLQPLWFWALLPALLVLWLLHKPREKNTAWRRVCDAGLLPYLLTRPGSSTSQLPLWLLGTNRRYHKSRPKPQISSCTQIG